MRARRYARSRCASVSKLHDGAYVEQVASLPVVGESVTHDEVVGYLHRGVLDVEVLLKLVGLHEQRADVERVRIARAEALEHALHGLARVHDVFHDDHGAALQLFVDADYFLDPSRRRRALVGGELHELYLAWYGDISHQVGGEHERAVENGQEQRVLAVEVLIDFLRNGLTRR